MTSIAIVTAKAGANLGSRIAALDFTKGALVLMMVLYHWLNYFISPDGDFYRYIRFTTPGFIFITGFLLSYMALSRYNDGGYAFSKRLVSRGLKLLLIFAGLNSAISVLIPDSYNGSILFGRMSLEHAIAIYGTGNIATQQGKLAAFYILVPISYVLIIAAAVVLVTRVWAHFVHLLCGVAFGSVAALRLAGFQSPNLEWLAVGLLGMVCGYIPLDRINKFAAHPYLLAGAYLCYLGALSVWDATYVLQIVGVCLNVLVLYIAGTRVQDAGSGAQVIRLGRYSLFAYIAQIGVLQLIYRCTRGVDAGLGLLPLSLFAAFALTLVLVEVVARAREKSPMADRLYKAVFA